MHRSIVVAIEANRDVNGFAIMGTRVWHASLYGVGQNCTKVVVLILCRGRLELYGGSICIFDIALLWLSWFDRLKIVVKNVWGASLMIYGM